ncbi:FAD-binding protein [Benzoatithermus flavus]|uniref:FAD-binding protein n=1 Tax=Benzoatithermus flavus TaxID=3108223 RepID=A0ABU8XMZ2_9PROT
MEEQAILRPKNAAELADLVAWAMAEEEPLEVLGAGTKRGLGRPVEASHAVSVAGLAGIDLYEPEELVMRAGAGTPLSVIEAALAEHGQELAFEPADYGALLGGAPGGQTIGGVFACNLSGPRRFKSGAARDHLLGLHCVTGLGQVIKTGGRVVKNVTGYDLCKLLTGSYGTLAVMTEVTFKVLPRAESSLTVLATGPDEVTLLALLRAATGTPCEIAGAAYLPPLAAGRSAVGTVGRAGRGIAAVRLEGVAPSVRYRSGELQRLLARPGIEFQTIGHEESLTLWREIRNVTLLTRERPLWRLSVAPTAGAELAAWAAELTNERLFDWAGGLIWLAVKESWARESGTIREALAGRGGHATLVRGPDWLRREIEPFQPLPASLRALTERVKHSFDPKGILNPGRMYPGM